MQLLLGRRTSSICNVPSTACQALYLMKAELLNNSKRVFKTLHQAFSANVCLFSWTVHVKDSLSFQAKFKTNLKLI